MKGFNAWIGSGNVGQPIKFATTKKQVPCCSFMVACERKGVLVWVRVNVYGENLVENCRSNLRVGGYIQVQGELMNRAITLDEKVTEVRGTDLIFLNRPIKDNSDFTPGNPYKNFEPKNIKYIRNKELTSKSE